MATIQDIAELLEEGKDTQKIAEFLGIPIENIEVIKGELQRQARASEVNK